MSSPEATAKEAVPFQLGELVPEAVSPKEKPADKSAADAAGPADGKAAHKAGVEEGAAARPAPAEKKDDKEDLEAEGFFPLYTVQKEEDPRQAARRQAEEITNRAEAELKSAQAQAEGIRKKAHDQGFEQGRAQGVEAERARVEAMLDNLGRMAEELGRVKARVLAAMEPELLALVQAVVDRLFLSAEALPKELLKKVTGHAVQRLVDAEAITIRVCPKDLAAMKEFRPELIESLEREVKVLVRAEDSLGPGGCRVSCPTAQVDATLATRRERVFAMLEQAMRQGDGLDIEGFLAKSQEPVKEPKKEAAAESVQAGEDLDLGSDLDLEDW